MIPADDAGQHYDLGHHDGYATARGEIVRGLHMRAAAAERRAASAPTVNMRAASQQVAAWLRELADQIKAGEL
jgi:hypothetical protein